MVHLDTKAVICCFWVIIMYVVYYSKMVLWFSLIHKEGNQPCFIQL